MIFATVLASQDYSAAIQQFFSQTFQIPANFLGWPVVLYAVIIPVLGAFLGFLWLLRDFGFFKNGDHSGTINVIIAAFFTFSAFKFIITTSIIAYALLAIAFIVWIINKIASW